MHSSKATVLATPSVKTYFRFCGAATIFAHFCLGLLCFLVLLAVTFRMHTDRVLYQWTYASAVSKLATTTLGGGDNQKNPSSSQLLDHGRHSSSSSSSSKEEENFLVGNSQFAPLQKWDKSLEAVLPSSSVVHFPALDKNKKKNSKNNFCVKLPDGAEHLYIAANLHNSEEVLPTWLREMKRFLLLLTQCDNNEVSQQQNQKDKNNFVSRRRRYRVFVSIFTNQCYDKTNEILARDLRPWLDAHNIPHDLQLAGTVEGGYASRPSDFERIDWLSRVRNAAMKPLWDRGTKLFSASSVSSSSPSAQNGKEQEEGGGAQQQAEEKEEEAKMAHLLDDLEDVSVGGVDDEDEKKLEEVDIHDLQNPIVGNDDHRHHHHQQHHVDNNNNNNERQRQRRDDEEEEPPNDRHLLQEQQQEIHGEDEVAENLAADNIEAADRDGDKNLVEKKRRLEQKLLHAATSMMMMMKRNGGDLLNDDDNDDYDSSSSSSSLLLPSIESTRVLFLNDIVFSAEDMLLLLHTNRGHYDMACGMDYYFNFYDTWVSRDLDDRPLWGVPPYTPLQETSKGIRNLRPVQVSCCWNGAVAVRAGVFLKKRNKHKNKNKNKSRHRQLFDHAGGDDGDDDVGEKEMKAALDRIKSEAVRDVENTRVSAAEFSRKLRSAIRVLMKKVHHDGIFQQQKNHQHHHHRQNGGDNNFEKNVAFRTATRPDICSISECLLLCHDMKQPGFGGFRDIFINPIVRVAYDLEGYLSHHGADFKSDFFISAAWVLEQVNVQFWFPSYLTATAADSSSSSSSSLKQRNNNNNNKVKPPMRWQQRRKQSEKQEEEERVLAQVREEDSNCMNVQTADESAFTTTVVAYEVAFIGVLGLLFGLSLVVMAVRFWWCGGSSSSSSSHFQQRVPFVCSQKFAAMLKMQRVSHYFMPSSKKDENDITANNNNTNGGGGGGGNGNNNNGSAADDIKSFSSTSLLLLLLRAVKSCLACLLCFDAGPAVLLCEQQSSEGSGSGFGSADELKSV